MSITIWLLILRHLFGFEWHEDHSHACSTSQFFVVEESIKNIHDFYLDIPAFGKSHPLIKDTQCITIGSYCYQYKIIERPFHWIPYLITYEAQIENPAYLSEIVYHISKIPQLKPTIFYQFEKRSPNQTKISVKVEVEGNPLFRRFLAKKIMKAQRVVIENQFPPSK